MRAPLIVNIVPNARTVYDKLKSMKKQNADAIQGSTGSLPTVSGVLNPFFDGFLYLSFITVMFTIINTINTVKFVRFATVERFPSDKNISEKPITAILAIYGVFVFSETFKKIFGRLCFFAIPYTILDAPSSITRTVLNVERSAISERIMKLFSPKTDPAISESGAPVAAKS